MCGAKPHVGLFSYPGLLTDRDMPHRPPLHFAGVWYCAWLFALFPHAGRSAHVPRMKNSLLFFIETPNWETLETRKDVVC